MNKRSNKKYFIILLILLLGITIGYAAINTTLNINGRSNISKNTWDVHFDNVTVKDGSVEAIKLPTIENNTTVDFEVNLNLPGDFYEFTVDVVNNGTIDAMIDNIEKTPDLTENQLKYINYIIEYQNEEQITTKQLVKSNEFVKIKVRVEYKKDISASDLPKNTETLNLGFNVNYVQSDGTGSSVPGKSLIKIVSGDGTQTSDEICIGDECFYVMYSDEDSVTMLAKYNLYINSENQNEAIEKQDSNMLGTDGSETAEGTLYFSTTRYWVSSNPTYPVYVYDSNSNLYSHIENYKTYLNTLGVAPIDARAIRMEELENLGCKNSYCNNAPKWVYSTSYWTGTAEASRDIFYVDRTGHFSSEEYGYYEYYGCRPVIVIPKSEVKVEEKQLIEFTIDSVTYQAKEGMTWEEWVNSKYNINGYFINSTFIFQFEAAFVTSDGIMSVNPSDIIDPRINYIVNDKGVI